MSPLIDLSSGLLNADYFAVAFPSRLAMARRALRPLSVVLLRPTGGEPWERGVIIQRCIRDSDTACQLDGETAGVILEETAEEGALWTAERLRRELEAAANAVCIGVATYPAHALDADGLLSSARDALVAASTWPESCIVVAHKR